MSLNVIVPLDGSAAAERALGCARPLAAATGGELILVTSTNLRVDYEDHASYLNVKGFGADRREILVGVGPAKAIDTVARRWAPSLVCMASHGRSARAAAVLGSVAGQVLAQGSAPVLVVGPGVGWPAGTHCDSILVCVNDSPESLSGVDAAKDLSTFLGLPLRVLTVVHDSVDAQRRRDTIRAHLTDVDVTADIEVLVSDDAVEALVGRAAAPGNILVIATRGATRTQKFILGGVALDLIARAANPVLAVPPHRAARPWRD